MNRGTEDKMPTGTMAGTPQVLLAHHLKQLKLPTVLREYERLARECARDGVDPSGSPAHCSIGSHTTSASWP